jgi:glyoxylase I family protein
LGYAPAWGRSAHAEHNLRDVWLYFDCPSVDAAYQVLHNKGVEVEEPVVTYYGMKQVSLLDPDGYQVVFQQPSKN